MAFSYGSVCSGIEAASAAWHHLGWSPEFFSEIEKFPSAVLAHHYGSNFPGGLPLVAEQAPERRASSRTDGCPDGQTENNHVPNYGDMTKFEEWPDHGPTSQRPIDLLVGGTPCQSFSIAGHRGGLDDARGNLMFTYASIARRYRPRWLVWENVPGVLSSDGGRDFASLLGLLSGKRITVPGKWKNSGYVTHGKYGYGLAWRVLDAQYVRVDAFQHAVPQRRKRVFVVGYLGDWRRAAAVLFEREGLSGNPAPCRKTGQAVAPTLSARTQGGGGLGSDFDIDGGVIAEREISATVSSKWAKGSGGPAGDECQNLVAYPLTAGMAASASRLPQEQGVLLPIAVSSKDYGGDAVVGVSPTLRAANHDKSHANAGNPPAIAIQERAVSENPAAGPDGIGCRDDGTSYTLEARQTVQAVAFMAGQGAKAGSTGANAEVSPTLRAADSGSNQVPSVAYGFEDKSRGDDGRGYERSPSFSENVGSTVGTVKPPAVAFLATHDVAGTMESRQTKACRVHWYSPNMLYPFVFACLSSQNRCPLLGDKL